MRSFAMVSVVAGLLVGPVHAAVFDVTPGATIQLPQGNVGTGNYDPQNAAGTDPWAPGDIVGIANEIGVNKGLPIHGTVRGGERGVEGTLEIGIFNCGPLGDIPACTHFYLSTEDAGKNFVFGEFFKDGTIQLLDSHFVQNRGRPNEKIFGLDAPNVAITFANAGRTLEIGFNELTTDLAFADGDFDDMRVSISAVPVPGAMPLLASGLVGLHLLRRRRDQRG